jgi:hypothetical protein
MAGVLNHWFRLLDTMVSSDVYECCKSAGYQSPSPLLLAKEMRLVHLSHLICPSLRLVIHPIDISHKILRLLPATTIPPLPSIIHTSYLPIQPHRTTRRNIRVLAPLHTLPQQPHTIRTRISTHAAVQHVETQSVFERTVFNQPLVWYFLVVVDHAVGEPEMQFWIRIRVRGAQ